MGAGWPTATGSALMRDLGDFLACAALVAAALGGAWQIALWVAFMPMPR
jgi:hypothetical protein